jgi:hypothetical protein
MYALQDPSPCLFTTPVIIGNGLSSLRGRSYRKYTMTSVAILIDTPHNQSFRWQQIGGHHYGSGRDEPMKRAMMGASAAAAIALASLCSPPAQARADNPCAGITDPAAMQACTAKYPRDNSLRRYLGDCEGASPLDGQVGQICG